MTKKQIKRLVEKSYADSQLNDSIVQEIADHLKRGDLKRYIKEVKKSESKKVVVISLPKMPSDSVRRQIEDTFPQKRIMYDLDPSLLVGIRIQDNDFVTECDLENTLDRLTDYIAHSYD